jgi:PIF1-like helicase
LFSLLSTYTCAKERQNKKNPTEQLQTLLTLNDHGKILFRYTNYVYTRNVKSNNTFTKYYLGIINNGPQLFSVNGLQFSKMAKPVIVNTCPFVPIDNNDEKSAYATLLVHSTWPIEGEEYLIHPEYTAVAKLKYIMDHNMLPSYVLPTLNRQQQSAAIAADTGVPLPEHENYDERVQHDMDSEIDHEIYVDSQHCDTESNQMANNDHDINIAVNGVHENITAVQKTYYNNFIQRCQENYINRVALDNQTEDTNQNEFHPPVKGIQKVKHHDKRLKKLKHDVSKLTTGQKSAYNKAIAHISGENPDQLIMFISGEGGTGKSYLIKLIMEYTRLKYGRQRGLYGATVALAPTGCAANVIEGYTWQSCYGKGRSYDNNHDNMTQQTAQRIGENFRGTKLVVIDEISMINLESIAEMSRRHQQGMLALTDDVNERENIMRRPFGGAHVLFTGDLWQLEAIGGHPVYSSKLLRGLALEGYNIWRKINEFSELTQNYRFKDDETQILENFLRGARTGHVDKELLVRMNKRLMISQSEARRLALPTATWIAHTRATVASFNNLDFYDKVEKGATHFRMVSFHTPSSDLIPRPNEETRKLLYQKVIKKRGTPTYIDLAIGTRVSCVRNLGTQVGKYLTY